MEYTNFFTTVINSYLPEPHASLLNGILFGVDLRGVKTFKDEVKLVGLSHIVVLSGTNITLLSAIVMGMTLNLGRKIAIVITVLTIILFILFVGIQAPIIRAGFMGILTLVATLYGRKTLALYSLVLSAVFSLVIWPQWLKSISFQLSYAATLGLILFKKGSVDTKEVQTLFSTIKTYCIEDLKTSTAAQVFTVPIIFLYFQQISIIAPLANLLISWVIAPLMIFGFLTAILGKIHFILGLLPSYICYILLSYVILVIHFLSQLPYIFFDFNS